MLDHSPSSERTSADATGSVPSVAPSPDPTDDSRRRHALRYLERFEYPVELRTVAAHVASVERSVPADVVSDADRERVAIRLHHVDVPKLVAGGFVEYDHESRMVVYTGGKNDCGRYTDTLDGSRSRQSDPA